MPVSWILDNPVRREVWQAGFELGAADGFAEGWAEGQAALLAHQERCWRASSVHQFLTTARQHEARTGLSMKTGAQLIADAHRSWGLSMGGSDT